VHKHYVSLFDGLLNSDTDIYFSKETLFSIAWLLVAGYLTATYSIQIFRFGEDASISSTYKIIIHGDKLPFSHIITAEQAKLLRSLTAAIIEQLIHNGTVDVKAIVHTMGDDTLSRSTTPSPTLSDNITPDASSFQDSTRGLFKPHKLDKPKYGDGDAPPYSSRSN